MMKLYCSKTSPYVRKIVFLVEFSKLGNEISYVQVPNVADFAEELTPFNPLVKIPCLVLESGDSLYDSFVIFDYLNAKFKLDLIPETLDQRMHALKWHSLAQGMMDASVNIFLERRRSENLRSEEWIKTQSTKLVNALKTIEQDLSKIGMPDQGLNIGNISIGCALEYMELRVGDIYSPNIGKESSAFLNELNKIQAFKQSAPPKG